MLLVMSALGSHHRALFCDVTLTATWLQVPELQEHVTSVATFRTVLSHMYETETVHTRFSASGITFAGANNGSQLI